MKINFCFSFFKDYSNISFGIDLLEILLSHGLEIDKFNDCEPIKNEYTKDSFLKTWTKHSDGSVLFKGKRSNKFTGLVSWYTNVHPDLRLVNQIDLWLTLTKEYNLTYCAI